jgi:hypothetical protein
MDMGVDFPSPDYSAFLRTMYWEATNAIIKMQPSFKVLSLATELSSVAIDAPSWVPDKASSMAYDRFQAPFKCRRHGPNFIGE